MGACEGCKADVSSCEALFDCDKCQLSFCQKCARLSSTETRAAVLKKRIMIFLCPGCASHYDAFIRVRDDQGGAVCHSELNESRSDLGSAETKIKSIVTNAIEQLVPGIFRSVLSELSGRVAETDNRVVGLMKMIDGLTKSGSGQVANRKSKNHHGNNHREAVAAASAISQELGAVCGVNGAAARSGSVAPALSGPALCQVEAFRDQRLTYEASSTPTSGAFCGGGGHHPGPHADKQSLLYEAVKSSEDRGHSVLCVVDNNVCKNGIQSTVMKGGPINGAARVSGAPSGSSDGESHGWTRVDRRRGRGRPGLKYGTGSASDELGAFKPASCIHISRIDLAYSREDVMKYVTSKMGPIVKLECEELPVRSQRYHSFKLSVPADEGERLLSSDFWPPGIAVRRFVHLKSHPGGAFRRGSQSSTNDSERGRV